MPTCNSPQIRKYLRIDALVPVKKTLDVLLLSVILYVYIEKTRLDINRDGSVF